MSILVKVNPYNNGQVVPDNIPANSSVKNWTDVFFLILSNDEMCGVFLNQFKVNSTTPNLEMMHLLQALFGEFDLSRSTFRVTRLLGFNDSRGIASRIVQWYMSFLRDSSNITGYLLSGWSTSAEVLVRIQPILPEIRNAIRLKQRIFMFEHFITQVDWIRDSKFPKDRKRTFLNDMKKECIEFSSLDIDDIRKEFNLQLEILSLKTFIRHQTDSIEYGTIYSERVQELIAEAGVRLEKKKAESVFRKQLSNARIELEQVYAKLTMDFEAYIPSSEACSSSMKDLFYDNKKGRKSVSEVLNCLSSYTYNLYDNSYLYTRFFINSALCPIETFVMLLRSPVRSAQRLFDHGWYCVMNAVQNVVCAPRWLQNSGSDPRVYHQVVRGNGIRVPFSFKNTCVTVLNSPTHSQWKSYHTTLKRARKLSLHLSKEEKLPNIFTMMEMAQKRKDQVSKATQANVQGENNGKRVSSKTASIIARPVNKKHEKDAMKNATPIKIQVEENGETTSITFPGFQLDWYVRSSSLQYVMVYWKIYNDGIGQGRKGQDIKAKWDKKLAAIILKDGTVLPLHQLHAYENTNPWKPGTGNLWSFLRLLNSDIIGVTAHIGKLTGQCMLCSKQLTTKVSLERGFGSTCMKKYNLVKGQFLQATYATDSGNGVIQNLPTGPRIVVSDDDSNYDDDQSPGEKRGRALSQNVTIKKKKEKRKTKLQRQNAQILENARQIKELEELIRK